MPRIHTAPPKKVDMTTLFDTQVARDGKGATDFIVTLLQASTEYSIIGKDMEGKILLWNEGARRLYGYEADEDCLRVARSSGSAP